MHSPVFRVHTHAHQHSPSNHLWPLLSKRPSYTQTHTHTDTPLSLQPFLPLPLYLMTELCVMRLTEQALSLPLSHCLSRAHTQCIIDTGHIQIRHVNYQRHRVETNSLLHRLQLSTPFMEVQSYCSATVYRASIYGDD